jgi:hypothetical protein
MARLWREERGSRERGWGGGGGRRAPLPNREDVGAVQDVIEWPSALRSEPRVVVTSKRRVKLGLPGSLPSFRPLLPIAPRGWTFPMRRPLPNLTAHILTQQTRQKLVDWLTLSLFVLSSTTCAGPNASLPGATTKQRTASPASATARSPRLGCRETALVRNEGAYCSGDTKLLASNTGCKHLGIKRKLQGHN